jgi:hypothetical protein
MALLRPEKRLAATAPTSKKHQQIIGLTCAAGSPL